MDSVNPPAQIVPSWPASRPALVHKSVKRSIDQDRNRHGKCVIIRKGFIVFYLKQACVRYAGYSMLTVLGSVPLWRALGVVACRLGIPVAVLGPRPTEGAIYIGLQSGSKSFLNPNIQ